MTPFNESKQQAQKQRSTKRRTLFPLLTLLALAAILLGALFSTGYFARSNLSHNSASAGTPITQPSIPPTQTTHVTTPSPTASVKTPIPTATVLATPTPVPTAKPKPTPAPPNYPHLDSQYSGGIHNTPGNIDGTMTLTNIHQNGADISGTLILSNGLSGTASFTNGTVSNNTLQFVVVPYTQYLPLLFQGHVNADGSLMGTYCSVQNNQCNYAAGGYGTWRVLPPSPSSEIPFDDNSRA